MARINTDRPEAMVYRGQEMAFVRPVTAADGPAFTEMVDQVIVRTSGGEEIYFFANEVTLSDDEKKAADKAAKKRDESKKEADELAARNTEGKKKLFEGTRAGTEKSKEQAEADKPNAGTGGIAPPDIPAHSGVSGQAQQGETNRFNRVPGEPPRTTQDIGGVNPGSPRTTDDGRNIGRSGYPEGSGPDPQGRRVDERDQSHSGTVERPAPAGERQGPRE